MSVVTFVMASMKWPIARVKVLHAAGQEIWKNHVNNAIEQSVKNVTASVKSFSHVKSAALVSASHNPPLTAPINATLLGSTGTVTLSTERVSIEGMEAISTNAGDVTPIKRSPDSKRFHYLSPEPNSGRNAVEANRNIKSLIGIKVNVGTGTAAIKASSHQSSSRTVTSVKSFSGGQNGAHASRVNYPPITPFSSAALFGSADINDRVAECDAMAVKQRACSRIDGISGNVGKGVINDTVAMTGSMGTMGSAAATVVVRSRAGVSNN